MEDNFDYQEYLKNNPLLNETQEEIKTNLKKICEELNIPEDSKKYTKEEQLEWFAMMKSRREMIDKQMKNLGII